MTTTASSLPHDESDALGSGRVNAARSWLRRHRGLLAPTTVLLIVAAWSVAPRAFAPDPEQVDMTQALRPPSRSHLFGTDNLGRDLFARVVDGTFVSVSSAVLAVTIGLFGGVAVGLTSGFGPRWLDSVLSRSVDVMLSIPGLIIVLSIVMVMGFGTVSVAVAVGVVSASAIARMMRSEVLRVSQSGFVTAARISGLGPAAVAVRHVLPNSLRPVLAIAPMEFSTAVLAIASASFLGFGAQPPSSEWGALVAAGRGYIATSWWLAIMPGLAITVLVVATNSLSRAVAGKAVR